MKVCFVFALLSLAEGARHQSKSRSEGLSWKQNFESYMADLMQTDDPDGFNPKCKPYISEPDGPSRGLVMLQHGYSACAGFWYLLAPGLVKEGWTVMVPNMIGHGRNPKVVYNGSDTYTVTDWSSDLPKSGSGYEEYTKELMSITRKYRDANPNKEMAVVGISHGGAVATYMALNEEPGVWDRVMLLNPFLAPPTALGADFGLSLMRYIIPEVLPAFSVVRETVTWGADCDRKRWPTDPRKGGHGGICQFSLENFAGVLEFGNLVEADARAAAATVGVFSGGLIDRLVGFAQLLLHKTWQVATGTEADASKAPQVQIITTAKDSSISNERVHYAAQGVKNSASGGKSSFCVVDAEFSHVYISPKDKPVTMDHWWLDANRVVGGKTMIDLLTGFVSDGALLPTSGTVTEAEDKALVGDPKCAIAKK